MPKPGDVIAGTYEVQERLGGGGMGSVYCVYDRSVERQRALKVMREDLREDAAWCDAFLREAKVRGRISSRYVVDVIACGIDEVVGPWMVMELFHGKTLEKRVEEDGPLPRVEVERLFVQLLDAIGKAHTAGVVHLDLKPSNLFLHEIAEHEPPELRVFDFGIARLLREGGRSTFMTKAVGSALWMAPGQVDKEVSLANDVWSLGLIAFHVLTGKTFWRSGEGSPLLLEITTLAIPAASERASELGVADRLPAGFDDWFALAVCRERERRFRDANESLPPLLALLREEPLVPASARTGDTQLGPTVVAPPPVRVIVSGVTSAAVATPSLRSRAGRVALSLGAALTVLVAAVGWWRGCGVDARRPDPMPSPPPPADVTVWPADAREPPMVCPAAMVPMRGGAFVMGDADPALGAPRRRVTVSPYCLDETEVTVGAFRVFWNAGHPSPTTAVEYPGARLVGAGTVTEPLVRSLENGQCTWSAVASDAADGESHPINCIDWYTLQAYCVWRHGRLPTEAEWEFAARGTDRRIYPWGNEPPTSARVNACGDECREAHAGWRAITDLGRDSYRETAPVGSFSATRPAGVIAAGYVGAGFRDLGGNVWEWVADAVLLQAEAPGAEGADPLGTQGDGRVSRGGGWDDSVAVWLRTSARAVLVPTHRYDNRGGRCASAPAR